MMNYLAHAAAEFILEWNGHFSLKVGKWNDHTIRITWFVDLDAGNSLRHAVGKNIFP